jgi:ABC-type glycerol-3-phosphate transport system substrate-binding protein
MGLLKKFIGFFLLVLFAVTVVACGETNTTEAPTTVAPTTAAPTSQAPTTAITTEEDTDTPPQFVGLFTKQTYYRGSVEFDILAGAKAIDKEDGELEIEILSQYSTTRVGEYSVYVYAEDSDGNVINDLITLSVKDISGFSIPDELTTENISITMWHANGNTIQGYYDSYVEEFNEIYPNITVEVTNNGGGYDDLRKAVVNAITGGQLPNIVQGYPDHVIEYIGNNAVVPLTPYIQHPVHGYDSSVADESFYDIVLNYRQENSQYTNDGEFYSVPFNKSTELMIYNKTFFDVLIANGTITEVPNTWQDLFAIAPELINIKDSVIDQIAAKINLSPDNEDHLTAEEIQQIKDDFVPITYDSPDNAFITLTKQWGGAYTGINSARNGVILFDNNQTKSMLSYFFDMRDTYFTIPEKWGLSYASDAFKKGQTAVTFGSSAGARYNTPLMVNGESIFEFGVMPMPYNKDMPEHRQAIQQGTNMSITVGGTDQQKLASWLFLKFLTSKEVQLDFSTKTGYSPVRESVYLTPEFQAFISGEDSSGNPLKGSALIMSLAAIAAEQQNDFLFYDQAFVGSSTAREQVEIAFNRVILQSLEGTTKQDIIDDAIAAAVANAERVIPQ